MFTCRRVRQSTELELTLLRTFEQAAIATHALKSAHSDRFAIDPLHSPHAAAVGATLAAFDGFQSNHHKSTSAAKEKLKPVTIELLGGDNQTASAASLQSDKSGSVPLDWETGKIYGRAQNLARELMELPANICTPTWFCERASKEFQGLANTEVIAHDLKWAEEKKMGSFISVSRGSDEPLRFLEIHYRGGAKDERPVALVGKGITFDSGGISLKPGAGMKVCICRGIVPG